MTKKLNDDQYARRILSAIEQSSDGMVLTDMKGNIEYANYAWLMMHSVAFSEVHGMSVSEAYEGAERDKMMVCFEVLAETGEYAAEFMHRQQGEVALPSIMFAKVIRDDVGNAIGVNIIERDISKMRQLEGMLRIMKESFANIVQKSVVGMLVVDEEGVILFANPSAERLFGRQVDSLLGRHVGIPILDRQMTETGFVCPDGKPGVAAMSMTHTEWEGQPAYLVMLNDVTKLKRAEDETKKLLQFKSDILANLSHELRTPINNIIGYVELAARILDHRTDDRESVYLERAMINAKSLLNTVNDLLAAASLQAEEAVIEQASFGLKEVITSCIESHDVVKANKAIKISVDVEAPDIHMVSDKRKISTIIGSLLSNAIKFTDEGEVKITARHLSGETGWVMIQVADTGIGISEDQLGRIFEGFKQLDGSMTRKYGGLGMGLFLVNWYTRILGGEIEVESELGKGSTFIVHLPLRYVERKTVR